jgi:hypothetical protein
MDAFNYTHITANTTKVIIAALGAGVPPVGILGGITVNNPGTSWVITIYDNGAASGNVIAAFTAANGYVFGPPIRLSAGLTFSASGTPGDLLIAWL